MITIHEIKIPTSVCNEILGLVTPLTETKKISSTNDIEVTVTKPAGYTPCCITDSRELDIWKTWKANSELDQIIYKSERINNLIPNAVFEHFKLDRLQCKIDVRRFHPGKLHVPHRDYYFNLSYPQWDIPPQNASELANRLSEMKTLPKEILSPQNIIRLWVTLTEPKFGHLLLVEDTAVYWLEQGSIVTWPIDKLHTAANLGYEDRFIVRITGYLNENT
jgi:hypothetical protein